MPAFQPAYPGAKQYLLAGYSEDTAAGSSTFFTRFARHAIAVTNNDPASIEPSRSNVFHEIASLFPKHPQLLTSVMTEDVAPIGCELVWKRSGDKLIAGHDPKRCRAGGAQPAGPEASLGPDSLSLAGYEFRKR